MDQETITPINHGFISGTATTVAESGKGGFRGANKGGLIGAGAFFGFWTVGGAAVGAVVGVGLAIFAGAFAAPTLAAGALIVATNVGISALIGGAVGAIPGALSSVTGGFAGTVIGGLIGLGGGALHGFNKVGQEKGAAQAVQAQLEAYKASLDAAAKTSKTACAANDNKYGFPTQGDAMNPAPTNIKVGADNAQLQGAVATPELQRAGA